MDVQAVMGDNTNLIRPTQQNASGVLCYSGKRGGQWGGYDQTGVHLTLDGRTTLCGRPVLDIPEVPRVVAPLSCRTCAQGGIR